MQNKGDGKQAHTWVRCEQNKTDPEINSTGGEGGLNHSIKRHRSKPFLV